MPAEAKDLAMTSFRAYDDVVYGPNRAYRRRRVNPRHLRPFRSLLLFYLFIYFIAEAYISTPARQIFVILVSFYGVSLQFSFSVQTSDRCPP